MTTNREAELSALLVEASKALEETGEAYTVLVGRFITHVDAERRMLNSIADCGRAEMARAFLPATETLGLELRAILTDLLSQEVE